MLPEKETIVASYDQGVTSCDERIRLSDVLAALSQALDLTEGQPEGHCVRATFIGMQIGQALGLPDNELWELYYTIMLKDLGCSSNAARICALYLTDDIGFKRDFKTVSDSLPKVLGFVFSHTGLKAGLAERFKAVLNILQNGGEIVDDLIQTRCHRGAEIAARLRFPTAVCTAIHALDEHWNGKGRPDQLAGSAIPLYARIALLAQVIDVFRTASGPAAALTEVRERSGTWFDPEVVAGFERAAEATGFWDTLDSDAICAIVSELEPSKGLVVVDDNYLDDIAQAFAQVIDAKSPFTSGHSERVAVYADMIAAELGWDARRRRWLKRAALLHDIGKLGVSNTILDKNGKLDDTEWAAMRGHALLSEMILERIPVFREMAQVGGSHHERLDGKGYPRGLKGDQISIETRVVTVADVFDALTANRPYRAAMSLEIALGIMRSDLDVAFDATCFEALEAALLAIENDLARAA